MVQLYNKTGVIRSIIPTIFAASAFATFLCAKCGGNSDNNLNYGDTLTMELEESGDDITIENTLKSHTPDGKEVITHPSTDELEDATIPISNHQAVTVSASANNTSATVTIVATDNLDILNKINNAELNTGSWWNILKPTAPAFITLTKSLHTTTATDKKNGADNMTYLSKYAADKHKIAEMIKEVETIEQKGAAITPADKMRLVYLYDQLIKILGSNKYVKDNDKAFVPTKTATNLISNLNKDKTKAGGISADPKIALTVENVANNYSKELADLKAYLTGHASSADPNVVAMLEMINAIQAKNPANLAKHELNAKTIYDGVKNIPGLRAGAGVDLNRNYFVDSMKIVILTITNAKYPEFYAEKNFPITPKV